MAITCFSRAPHSSRGPDETQPSFPPSPSRKVLAQSREGSYCSPGCRQTHPPARYRRRGGLRARAFSGCLRSLRAQEYFGVVLSPSTVTAVAMFSGAELGRSRAREGGPLPSRLQSSSISTLRMTAISGPGSRRVRLRYVSSTRSPPSAGATGRPTVPDRARSREREAGSDRQPGPGACLAWRARPHSRPATGFRSKPATRETKCTFRAV